MISGGVKESMTMSLGVWSWGKDRTVGRRKDSARIRRRCPEVRN
ncbi:hypothetical protein Goari_022616 [Gossypium aridum]|uniref:Uncharacterized protein n=1 Tax=Gossypium aridum TaxID=34290 RepID=A0A7J8YRJ1_GOSAI|nr:hypothetical protein [Gossypium aridum]